MNFSIRAIIRALRTPKGGLICSTALWRQIVAELKRRGHDRHEAGVFLLGREHAGRREVRATVFYDELDPDAYVTGVCVLHGDAFAKLWSLCREKKLTVVADVHTHGGNADQSSSDKANPMVARPGHVALIVPHFARWPIPRGRLRIYEYRGQHNWIDRSISLWRPFFYTGWWS
jgi:hypothetical protein